MARDDEEWLFTQRRTHQGGAQPTNHNTHAAEGPHMHQQQVKVVIFSLDMFLTPDDGHVGRNM
jgi:hypothetical protein